MGGLQFLKPNIGGDVIRDSQILGVISKPKTMQTVGVIAKPKTMICQSPLQSATLTTSPKPESSKFGLSLVRPPVEVDRQSTGIFEPIFTGT